MRSHLLRVIALVLLVCAAPAGADERILSFDSEITVHPDGKLSVRETIRVRAEGQDIRRGIYRDFPTIYPRQGGGQVTVGFAFRAAARDGNPEPWRVEPYQNGMRVYLGSAAVMLPQGEHVYVLSYDTDRQMGYFADHDELYWNATGNGWGFAIDRATARVLLPPAVPADQVKLEAYTGAQGSGGQDFRARLDNGQPLFESTRPFGPRESLTIVATWPKGFIMPGVEAEQPLAPGASTSPGYDAARDAGVAAAAVDPQAGWSPIERVAGRPFARSHAPLGVALVGLGLLLFYYYRIWDRVGRDPPGKVIIPEYEPPAGFSPAAMRYLVEWGYDNQCFAAAVLSIAIKGHLRLEENDGLLGFGKSFTLEKIDPPTPGAKPLSDDERALLERVFRSGNTLVLKQQNHSRVRSSLAAHESALDSNYSRGFFAINGGWHFLGILLSFAIAGLTFLLPGTAEYWPDYFLGTAGGWATDVVILLVLIANGVFGKLLKAPTVAGRAALDHILGFKMYLEVAEGEELRKLTKPPPPLTPQLFEAYLPMALALGVEQRWAERFAAVFNMPATSYSPAWYVGTSFNAHNIAGFSAGMSSTLSSAISSSSTAPGTKSGGGGGGSAGGGGGGGGGGGW
jgi:uncharacterized membrane protein YgcG